jgi:penicillin-binding protein activator
MPTTSCLSAPPVTVRRAAVVRLLAFASLPLLHACASAPPAVPRSGAPVTYRDVGSSAPVTVGTDPLDIVAVTDLMVRDILSSPFVAGLTRPPVILIDSERFSLEGTQRLNRSLIIDRLRVNLQRASHGRLMFVSRAAAADVALERDLKERGVTDAGTRNLADRVAGLDYRLYGRMATQDMRHADGTVSRYTQFTFELVDQQRSLSVWANQYEFKKSGRELPVY